MSGPKPKPVTERLAAGAEPNGDGCLVWMGNRNSKNYGRLWTGSRTDGSGAVRLAHVVAYELAHGPVPDGMQVDHVCHTEAMLAGLCEGGRTCEHRACIRPDHLVAKTRAENARMTNHPKQVAHRTGVCVSGRHTFTPGTECRECATERIQRAKRRPARRSA